MASSEHFARRLYRCPPESSTPAAPGLQPWAEWVAQQTEHWRRPRFQNWDVGSLCSGLGVCQLVGMALQKAVAASGVARVQIRHIFQAELSPSKRSILLARPGCAHLFGDISELEAAGQAYDYRCGEMRPIPRCDLAVCGFSCKDLSGLNTRPASIADKYRFPLGIRYPWQWGRVGVFLGNITCLSEINPRSRLQPTSNAIEDGELSCQNVGRQA